MSPRTKHYLVIGGIAAGALVVVMVITRRGSSSSSGAGVIASGSTGAAGNTVTTSSLATFEQSVASAISGLQTQIASGSTRLAPLPGPGSAGNPTNPASGGAPGSPMSPQTLPANWTGYTSPGATSAGVGPWDGTGTPSAATSPTPAAAVSPKTATNPKLTWSAAVDAWNAQVAADGGHVPGLLPRAFRSRQGGWAPTPSGA